MCFNSSFVPHKSDVAYSDIFLKLPINVKLKHMEDWFSSQRVVPTVWWIGLCF